LGAIAGGTGAALGILAGGGSLATALGLSDTAALAGGAALGSGLVTPGGKLDQVLDALADNYGNIQPTNIMDALKVIQQATAQVGLEPGVAIGTGPQRRDHSPKRQRRSYDRGSGRFHTRSARLRRVAQTMPMSANDP